MTCDGTQKKFAEASWIDYNLKKFGALIWIFHFPASDYPAELKKTHRIEMI